MSVFSGCFKMSSLLARSFSSHYWMENRCVWREKLNSGVINHSWMMLNFCRFGCFVHWSNLHSFILHLVSTCILSDFEWKHLSVTNMQKNNSVYTDIFLQVQGWSDNENTCRMNPEETTNVQTLLQFSRVLQCVVGGAASWDVRRHFDSVTDWPGLTVAGRGQHTGGQS